MSDRRRTAGAPVWAAAFAIVLLAAACAPAEDLTEPLDDEPLDDEPEPVDEDPEELPEPDADDIVVGVLNPTTGPFAAFGQQVNNGVRLAVDMLDGSAGGAALDLRFTDTAGEPEQALDQARRLVEQEGADVLMGVINSAVVPPLAEYAREAEVPILFSVGGARVVTGPDRNPFVFRSALANGQQDAPLGWYAAAELGYQRVATYAWDFIVGEERAGAFTETFEAGGGETVLEQRPPLGTADYAPFLGDLEGAEVDALYAFFADAGALSFVQQLRDFGFDTPILASDYFTAGVLDEMGEAALGTVQAGGYFASVETAENEAFVTDYEERFGDVPGVYPAEGYLAALVLADAIEAVGGNLDDTQAFLDALAQVELDGPGGPFRFDDRGQAVRNVYIAEVTEGGDGPVHTIVEVIDAVSQDWTP